MCVLVIILMSNVSEQLNQYIRDEILIKIVFSYENENFIIYFLLRCWLFHWKQLLCGSNHNIKAALKLHFCIFLFSSCGYPPPSSLKTPFKKAGNKMLAIVFFIFEGFLLLL